MEEDEGQDTPRGTAKNKECKYKVDERGMEGGREGGGEGLVGEGWAGWVVHIRWATYNARTLGTLEAPQAMPVKGRRG